MEGGSVLRSLVLHFSLSNFPEGRGVEDLEMRLDCTHLLMINTVATEVRLPAIEPLHQWMFHARMRQHALKRVCVN